MEYQNKHNKLIALALYEIKSLLSSHLGSDNKGDKSLRLAAHLSYALHNEALASLEGNEFNVDEAISKIKAIDNILKEDYSTNFIEKYNEK